MTTEIGASSRKLHRARETARTAAGATLTSAGSTSHVVPMARGSSLRLGARLGLWVGAFVGFYRPAVAELGSLDAVSRFLYSARSVILVISAQAALIAGLLAARDREFHAGAFARVVVGLVCAHWLSNLSNDYVGFRRGHDVPGSPRVRYTAHPFAPGVLSRREFAVGIGLVALTGAAVMATFIAERGWLAATFAAAGLVLLYLYDAAPVPLKSVALGELAVFVVWGPLMIGGGYAMITGHVGIDAYWASVPYGFGVATVLLGKHIDQLDFDATRRIRTLPVAIGARAARTLVSLLLTLIYGVIAALIATRHLTPFAAVSIFAIPQAVAAIAVLRRPPPATAPRGYIGWPLWYHRACLRHHRWFGWAYIIGLAAGATWPELGRI